jgi:hypothetical protein
LTVANFAVDILAQHGQCCQMVYFRTKNLNVGTFWKVHQKTMLVFLWPICLFWAKGYNLRPYGTFCGNLFYSSCFGMLHREKSGNPEHHLCVLLHTLGTVELSHPSLKSDPWHFVAKDIDLVPSHGRLFNVRP